MPQHEYNQVAPRLFQGSEVDPRRDYRRFTMIVLCAEEIQPEMPRFGGKVIRPSFRDTSKPTDEEIARARHAAKQVAVELSRKGTVLVTCAAGWNRSGLVTGLTLNLVTRLTADQIIARIRRARGEYALSNPTFARLVTECNRHQGCILC